MIWHSINKRTILSVWAREVTLCGINCKHIYIITQTNCSNCIHVIGVLLYRMSQQNFRSDHGSPTGKWIINSAEFWISVVLKKYPSQLPYPNLLKIFCERWWAFILIADLFWLLSAWKTLWMQLPSELHLKGTITWRSHKLGIGRELEICVHGLLELRNQCEKRCLG